jgi:hypothetical protein
MYFSTRGVSSCAGKTSVENRVREQPCCLLMRAHLGPHCSQTVRTRRPQSGGLCSNSMYSALLRLLEVCLDSFCQPQIWKSCKACSDCGNQRISLANESLERGVLCFCEAAEVCAQNSKNLSGKHCKLEFECICVIISCNTTSQIVLSLSSYALRYMLIL